MHFLNKHLWPLIKHDAYCSDSYSCSKYQNSHPFPVKRSNDWEHVGQVFDGNGVPRQSDIDIIKNGKLNSDCVP